MSQLDALQLLNQLLADFEPGATIHITQREAELLASLRRNRLGDLADACARVGARTALESMGLFGRNVLVRANQ